MTNANLATTRKKICGETLQFPPDGPTHVCLLPKAHSGDHAAPCQVICWPDSPRRFEQIYTQPYGA